MITVTGIGRLTRDPEQRSLPSGDALVEFGVAFDGRKKGETTFIDAVLFGARGESFVSYFHKGKPIAVTGELRQENWEDRQTGQKRSKLKIVVSSWSFVPRDKDADQGQPAPEPRQRPAPPAFPPPNPNATTADDALDLAAAKAVWAADYEAAGITDDIPF